MATRYLLVRGNTGRIAKESGLSPGLLLMLLEDDIKNNTDTVVTIRRNWWRKSATISTSRRGPEVS